MTWVFSHFNKYKMSTDLQTVVENLYAVDCVEETYTDERKVALIEYEKSYAMSRAVELNVRAKEAMQEVNRLRSERADRVRVNAAIRVVEGVLAETLQVQSNRDRFTRRLRVVRCEGETKG